MMNSSPKAVVDDCMAEPDAADYLPRRFAVKMCSRIFYAMRVQLELTDDHPLLWDFKHESASAYFYRAPVNADAAVGALYEAHQNAVGSWIRFGQHLNSAPSLSKLLAAGNGLLAEGPVPLLTLYKEALRPHGVEVDIRFSRPPQTWDGTHWRQLKRENNTKALLLGTSYVIGSRWSAEQTA